MRLSAGGAGGGAPLLLAPPPDAAQPGVCTYDAERLSRDETVAARLLEALHSHVSQRAGDKKFLYVKLPPGAARAAAAPTAAAAAAAAPPGAASGRGSFPEDAPAVAAATRRKTAPPAAALTVAAAAAAALERCPVKKGVFADGCAEEGGGVVEDAFDAAGAAGAAAAAADSAPAAAGSAGNAGADAVGAGGSGGAASDSTFCLRQPGCSAGSHGCSRVRVSLRRARIDRWALYPGSAYGAVYVAAPGLAPLLAALRAKVDPAAGPATAEASNGEPCGTSRHPPIKVRCTFDQLTGLPAATVGVLRPRTAPHAGTRGGAAGPRGRSDGFTAGAAGTPPVFSLFNAPLVAAQRPALAPAEVPAAAAARMHFSPSDVDSADATVGDETSGGGSSRTRFYSSMSVSAADSESSGSSASAVVAGGSRRLKSSETAGRAAPPAAPAAADGPEAGPASEPPWLPGASWAEPAPLDRSVSAAPQLPVPAAARGAVPEIVAPCAAALGYAFQPVNFAPFVPAPPASTLAERRAAAFGCLQRLGCSEADVVFLLSHACPYKNSFSLIIELELLALYPPAEPAAWAAPSAYGLPRPGGTLRGAADAFQPASPADQFGSERAQYAWAAGGAEGRAPAFDDTVARYPVSGARGIVRPTFAADGRGSELGFAGPVFRPAAAVSRARTLSSELEPAGFFSHTPGRGDAVAVDRPPSDSDYEAAAIARQRQQRAFRPSSTGAAGGRRPPEGRFTSGENACLVSPDILQSPGGAREAAPGTAGTSQKQLKQSVVSAPFSLTASETVQCFFWDLEATGLRVAIDDITQIACLARRFSPQAGWGPVHGEFNRYVRTDRSIPTEVVTLTGITEEHLRQFGVPLAQALDEWEAWARAMCGSVQRPIWFVAHNGNCYDLPLLLHQELRRACRHPGSLLVNLGVEGLVDTVILSRRLPWASSGKLQVGSQPLPGSSARGAMPGLVASASGLTSQVGARPADSPEAVPAPAVPRKSHTLKALYRELLQTELPNAHDALGDVRGLAALMECEPFFGAWQSQPVAWRLADYLKLQIPHIFAKSRRFAASPAATSGGGGDGTGLSLIYPAFPQCRPVVDIALVNARAPAESSGASESAPESLSSAGEVYL